MANKTKYSADELATLRALSSARLQQRNAAEPLQSSLRTEQGQEQEQQQHGQEEHASGSAFAALAAGRAPMPLALRDIEVACGGFRSEQHIGSGGTAVVYLAQTHGERYAVKLLRSDGSHERSIASKEVALLAMCHHPNVQRCLAFCLGPKLCIIYPALYGTVRDRVITTTRGMQLLDRAQFVDDAKERLARLGVSQPSAPLPWHHRLRVVRDVSAALLYLHAADARTGKPSIIHSDLTSENVLLAEDGRAVLHDMGYSKLFVKAHARAGEADLSPVLVECGNGALAKQLRLDSEPLRVRMAHGEDDGGADAMGVGFILMELATSWTGPELTGPVEYNGKRLKSHRASCEAVAQVAKGYPDAPEKDQRSGLMPLPGLDPDAQWPLEIAHSTVPSLLSALNSFQALTKPAEVLKGAVRTIDAAIRTSSST